MLTRVKSSLWHAIVVLVGLDTSLTSREGAREVELAGNTVDSVGGVDVLDQGDLVTSCGTLAGSNSCRSKEVLPDLYLLEVTS